MTTQQPTPPQAPPFGAPISLGQAKRAVDAALLAASELGIPNAIAVVEPSGDLVYFVRMDGAPYSATDLAQKKAWTSARYRRATKAFYDGLAAGHQFFLTFPGISAVPGGSPIVVDGQLVGAIGVSGGNADQDLLVSEKGANPENWTRS